MGSETKMGRGDDDERSGQAGDRESEISTTGGHDQDSNPSLENDSESESHQEQE